MVIPLEKLSMVDIPHIIASFRVVYLDFIIPHLGFGLQFAVND